MGKRSRDVSFSPSADETCSSVADSELLSETDEVTARVRHKMSEAASSFSPTVMQCSLPPHRDSLQFSSIESFELHYVKDHTNRCSECSNNFPTAHFLTLHIDENHNPLRESLEAKGEKTYACFVEDCDKKCSTPQKRKLHLIDKHMFPKMYNFRVVDTGIDRSTSMLREPPKYRVSMSDQKGSFGHRRRSSNARNLGHEFQSATTAEVMETDHSLVNENHNKGTTAVALRPRKEKPTSLNPTILEADGEMQDLMKSMSALKFIPPSVLMKDKKKKRRDS